MTLAIVLLIFFIALTIGSTALLFDMLAKSDYHNVDKKAVVTLIIAIIVQALCVICWANDWKNEALKAYDRGEIKKVVTYSIKSIDGNVIKKDSTYIYKVVK